MTTNIKLPIAHVARAPDGTWRAPHDLAEHLTQVGLAGRWHDLGKYRPCFQHYIRQASGHGGC